jgi:hypothetical protein
VTHTEQDDEGATLSAWTLTFWQAKCAEHAWEGEEHESMFAAIEERDAHNVEAKHVR